MHEKKNNNNKNMHPQPNSPRHTHQAVMSLIKELYAVCSKAPAG